jgi:hypothetical protein
MFEMGSVGAYWREVRERTGEEEYRTRTKMESREVNRRIREREKRSQRGCGGTREEMVLDWGILRRYGRRVEQSIRRRSDTIRWDEESKMKGHAKGAAHGHKEEMCHKGRSRQLCWT